MLKESALAFVRHLLTFAGGGLVSGGYVAGDELTGAVGAVTFLIGLAWSIAEKRLRAKGLITVLLLGLALSPSLAACKPQPMLPPVANPSDGAYD